MPFVIGSVFVTMILPYLPLLNSKFMLCVLLIAKANRACISIAPSFADLTANWIEVLSECVALRREP